MKWNHIPARPATSSFSRFLAATSMVAGLCSVAAPVFSATIVDPLNDWHFVAGHSPGIIFDTKNGPAMADGDNSRAVCQYGTPRSSFYYHFGGISAISISVYYYQEIAADGVTLYASPDGVSWTPIIMQSTTPQRMQIDIWYGETESSVSMPPGTNYVAIRLHAEEPYWTVQVGEVQIECANTFGLQTAQSQVTVAAKPRPVQAVYNSPAIVVPTGATAPPASGVPTGFSVTSAHNQAFLDWFPVVGADSYNISRRSVDSSTFRDIATHVPFNYYLDTSIKSGHQYYYSVTANVNGVTSPTSDLVLAAPQTGTVLMADSFDDWGLVAARTHNLDITDCDGGIECVKRTSAGRESFEYKMPNASSFAFDVAWNGGDLSSQVSVDVSSDGYNWTTIPLATMLPPVMVKRGWLEAIAINDGKLPNNVNLVRVNLGSFGDTSFESPLVSNVRITFGGSMDGSDSTPPVASAQVPPTLTAGPIVSLAPSPIMSDTPGAGSFASFHPAARKAPSATFDANTLSGATPPGSAASAPFARGSRPAYTTNNASGVTPARPLSAMPVEPPSMVPSNATVAPAASESATPVVLPSASPNTVPSAIGPASPDGPVPAVGSPSTPSTMPSPRPAPTAAPQAGTPPVGSPPSTSTGTSTPTVAPGAAPTGAPPAGSPASPLSRTSPPSASPQAAQTGLVAPDAA